MAYKVEWTAQAIEGHDEIIHYLESNFTDEEIQSFVNETYEFIELLKIYPFLLQKSNQKETLRRGPMNKYTMITYQVDQTEKIIYIINFISTRKTTE